MFESAQHQVGHKGRHNLQGQGILAFAQRLFDFVDSFKPTPPFFDVAVATHKKIDLAFQTQVFKLKRGPRKRSAGSVLSPTLRQNSVAEGIDETPADSSTTVCDGPSPARASATGNQDHSRTPGG